MPEQNQKKKKLRIVKQILKWMELGIITALILGALIFDAPWKVLTLLLIILAACTIFPKGAGKWFWLSVAAVVIVLIIWVFLPDDDEGWRPYTFDKELAALEAKYAIPDSENAATIYNKFLQDYDWEDFYANLSQEKLPMREPWLSKEHPKIAEWLNLHQNTMQTLLKVSKMEKCRFPITDPTNFEKQMNRNAAMRQWAFLLISAVNNDIAEDRVDEALQKNFTLLQMGNHLYQQPATADLLVGMAIRALALPELKRFVITGDPKETHLRAIEEALGNVKYDWGPDIIRILESNKLSTKRILAKYYEINEKGNIRLSRDPLAEMRACWKQQLENNEIKEQRMRKDLESYVYLTYWQRKLIKAETILHWFYIPSSPQKAAELVDTIYQNYYEIVKPDFDWSKEPRELPITARFKFMLNRYRTMELLPGVSEKPYYRIHEQHLRLSTIIKASQLIIALRRHKNKHSHWPESLDEVKPFASAEIFVDPINGSSFVYKLADDSFKLYSKGKNNIDEDGKRDQWGYKPTGADDWLIWPPRGRKPKTEEEPQK